VANGTSVVIVVQDLFFAVRITDTLRALGYKAVTAQNVHELRAALISERPRLVILDLQMQGVEPHLVMQVIREAAPGRVIPVLAFGPHTDVKRRNEALQAGCQRVVPKSVLAAELPQLVKSLLSV